MATGILFNPTESWIDTSEPCKITGEDILKATEGLYFVNLLDIRM
jgi:hypothetical protein